MHRHTQNKKSGLLLCLCICLPGASLSFIPASPPRGSSRAFLRRVSAPSKSLRSSNMPDWLSADTSSSSSSSQPSKADPSQAYDVLLADLVFSTNDVRQDVIDKFHLCSDPAFLNWLGEKINSSNDPDEKIGLKSLMDTIQDLVNIQKVNEARAAAAAEEAVDESVEVQGSQPVQGQEDELSNSDVLRAAGSIDRSGAGAGAGAGGAGSSWEDQAAANAVKASEKFMQQEVTSDMKMSYETILKKLCPPYKPGTTVASAVRKNYEYCDAQLLKVLDALKGEREGVEEVISEIAVVQEEKMSKAAENLKRVSGFTLRCIVFCFVFVFAISFFLRGGVEGGE